VKDVGEESHRSVFCWQPWARAGLNTRRAWVLSAVEEAMPHRARLNISIGCKDSGIVANNCIAYCVFATESGMQGLKGAPGESGEGSCSTGFTGYYSWACPPDGLGGTTVNNCTTSP
jgi:hypothetical protein